MASQGPEGNWASSPVEMEIRDGQKNGVEDNFFFWVSQSSVTNADRPQDYCQDLNLAKGWW